MNRIYCCCALLLLPAGVLQAQGLFGGPGSSNPFGAAFKQSSSPSKTNPIRSDSSSTAPNSANDRFVGRGNDSSGGRATGSSAPATRSAGGAATGTPQTGAAHPPSSQADAPRRLSMIRPLQRIAFQYTPSTHESITAKLAARFSKLSSQHPSLGNVLFQLEDDGLLLLSGTVDSEDTRKLAANLARLEPGVRSIANHITIAGQ